MKQFIRVKQEGCRVLEIDIDTIRVLEVDVCDDGKYILLASTSTQMFDLVYGTFDECHFILNQIHDLMKVKLIDLRT